jgi:chorismate mutase
MTDTKLREYRKKIDELDAEIVSLLAKRMDVVKAVGVWKKEQNIPPLQESRWQEVLSSKMKQAEEAGIDPVVVKDIFNRIHAYALVIEEEV